jgi:hypothetical protein
LGWRRLLWGFRVLSLREHCHGLFLFLISLGLAHLDLFRY